MINNFLEFFIICKCHFCILTSVTILFLCVTFMYWLLLPYSFCTSLSYIDFCYHILHMSHFCVLISVTIFSIWVTFAYWLLLPYYFCTSLSCIDFCYHILDLSHFRILISVTIFFIWVTFVYWFLLLDLKLELPINEAYDPYKRNTKL